MARVGSVAYQVSKIIKAHNGVGRSKLEAREQSQLTGENGHKISEYFHSYKSLDNARRDLMNLGKFARQEFGVKDMKRIDKQIIEAWINHKDVSYRTASNYLSEIQKVREHLSISKEEVQALRQELHQKLERQREVAEMTRSYKNLEKVQIAERSRLAFELQRDYGLRAKEATHINVNRQLDRDNTLHVQSKGGKEVIVKLDKKIADDIRATASKNNGKYEVNYKTYTRDLKEALERAGNVYNGTHGLRHSFAQKMLEKGYTKAQVSDMMGHVREEITDVYLR